VLVNQPSVCASSAAATGPVGAVVGIGHANGTPPTRVAAALVITRAGSGLNALTKAHRRFEQHRCARPAQVLAGGIGAGACSGVLAGTTARAPQAGLARLRLLAGESSGRNRHVPGRVARGWRGWWLPRFRTGRTGNPAELRTSVHASTDARVDLAHRVGTAEGQPGAETTQGHAWFRRPSSGLLALNGRV